jgi:hypothetical protein
MKVPNHNFEQSNQSSSKHILTEIKSNVKRGVVEVAGAVGDIDRKPLANRLSQSGRLVELLSRPTLLDLLDRWRRRWQFAQTGSHLANSSANCPKPTLNRIASAILQLFSVPGL